MVRLWPAYMYLMRYGPFLLTWYLQMRRSGNSHLPLHFQMRDMCLSFCQSFSSSSAYIITQFHHSKYFFMTYIPFTNKHHSPTSFATTARQHSHMSYIPIPLFLIVSRKRPVQHPIHNSFLVLSIIFFVDTHVNPRSINSYSPSRCLPPSKLTPSAPLPPPSSFSLLPPFTSFIYLRTQ